MLFSRVPSVEIRLESLTSRPCSSRPELRHRLGGLGHALLLPAVGDRVEHRQQRRRRGDQHAPGHRVLDQLRVGLQRGAVQVLAGQEHHHQVGRGVELGPVGLVGERLDVLAQQPGVIAQVAQALLLVARLVGVEHALQRCLGVDHDVLAAGHVDDQVGPQHRPVVAQRGLLDEVAVAHHPGELDHVAQLHLAPLAAGVGLAQRGDERAGLGPQAARRYRPASAAAPRAGRATRGAPGPGAAAGRRRGRAAPCSGFTSCSTASRRLSRSPLRLGLGGRSCTRVSSDSCDMLDCSASALSALNDADRRSWASLTVARRSSARVRSCSSSARERISRGHSATTAAAAPTTRPSISHRASILPPSMALRRGRNDGALARIHLHG